ncbi:MAG: hypothetical protein OS112_06075 [Methanoregula sp.]|nr:MAG: hypothetical protein OS112_06075 [Methanoregula sp.]
MDKIIKIAASIFIVIIVIFAGTTLYGSYVEKEYRRTLVSTYSYTLTISTSGELRNVTFFIPVPANPNGNSPFVEQFSIGNFTGIPVGWDTTLLGSSKATMLKIQAPVILGGGGAGFSVHASSDARASKVIDTKSPQDSDIVLRPVQESKEVSCPEFKNSGFGGICHQYQSAVYADYESSQIVKVEISSTVTGKNEWKIFEPAYNRYTNSISAMISGENHGWVIAKGELQSGIGSYDVPAISQ